MIHFVMKCCAPTNSATFTSYFSCACAAAPNASAIAPTSALRIILPPRRKIGVRARFLGNYRLGITGGILRLPAPRIGAHLVKPQLRSPAEQPLGATRVGVAGAHITGPAADKFSRDLLAGGAAKRVHDLQDGIAS